MRKGIAVSPGVSIGTAYCINAVFVNPTKQRLSEPEITAELEKYEQARLNAGRDLHALEKKVESQVGREEAAIFAVHQSMLKDSAFTKKIHDWIVDEKLSAPAALQRLLKEYAALLNRSRDQYFQERVQDIKDIIERISAHLSEVCLPDQEILDGPLIVVADELLPSQAVSLGDVDVRGIVTQRGSQTSHAAIIARSRGIPAVSGIRGILRQVKTGDTIVVDGRDGHVKINPAPETLSAYRKLEREFFDLKDQLVENKDSPAITSDAVSLELLSNINSTRDAENSKKMGAIGVGLYRTEYLYLTHPDVPDEEEQFKNYCEVIAASPNQQVTIRTLDIGGDKTVAYLGHNHQEANPFMGWRSIRLSFEHPDFFTAQIRAILRAASTAPAGNVKVMFPMVTTVEEMRRVRAILRRAYKQLSREGKEFERVPVGMMLEVPAAAVSIDTLLETVDFVSVGSNDLVQYLMAADRDNPKVSHLCQPLSPPVLRVLRNVIRICDRAGKPITVCGEMAGQPRAFVLLLGMGLRRFSMSPAFVPSIKELARQISETEARSILDGAMKLKTTSQVQRFMAQQLERVAPNLAILETS